jgi:predicted transcriptional regulator
MMPDVKDIQRRRQMLDITQIELAHRAEVSQSLVAKLERGRVDAAYSKVKHIFEVLDRIEAGREPAPIKKLANSPVVGVQVTDPMGKAIELMQRHDYSQLPVFESGRAVGSISEGSVNEYLAGENDPSELSKMRVGELMGEAFPQVGEEMPRDAVGELLRRVPAVLITKRGKVAGIVTKADMLKMVKS